VISSSFLDVFGDLVLLHEELVDDALAPLPGADGLDVGGLVAHSEVGLGAVIGELTGRLRPLAVHPDLQGVLLQDDAVHGAVHGKDPSTHDLRLLLDERLVRLAVDFETVLVGETAHGVDLDGAVGLALADLKRLLSN